MGDMVFCKFCGTELHNSAKTCVKCGAEQHSATVGGKSRVTAALLALFLGGFGAQKFYLGKTSHGVLSILFFWTFIPAIIALIDFIIFITMTDEAFKMKYNN